MITKAKRLAIVVGVLSAALVCQTPLLADPIDSEKIANAAKDSVVFLKFYRIHSRTGAEDWSYGSGFIVNDAGLVVTAYHVVEPWIRQANAKQDPEEEKKRNPLYAYIGSIHNPTPVELDYLEGGEATDVALLRLRYPQKYNYSKVCFVPKIASGKQFVAIGFPLGKEFTVFGGYLSNDDTPEGRWSANSTFEVGASGGPVYDLNSGRVIGLIKGGLTRRIDDDVSIPISSLQYVTPVMWLRTILNNRGVNDDCGDQIYSPPQNEIAIDDRSLAQQELFRQQEELFTRMRYLLKNVSTPSKPFAIDTLARRYEGQEPSNVGIDANGGSYYGAYRLQAGPAMDGFIAYLRHKKPDFALRLSDAGGSEAARSRSVEFVKEWRALAEAQEFQDLQLKYILSTDYARLAARVKRPATAQGDQAKGLALDLNARSLALRAVFFSIANQHGPTTSLPFDALVQLGDLSTKNDRDLIEALYAARDRVTRYYPKINSEKFVTLLINRNELEKRDALFILSNE